MHLHPQTLIGLSANGRLTEKRKQSAVLEPIVVTGTHTVVAIRNADAA